MADTPENNSEPSPGIQNPERRRIMKLLAAGGVVTAASMVPGKWSSPVIKSGVLPVHAQVTPGRYEVRCNPQFDWQDDGTTVTLFLSATAWDTLDDGPAAGVSLTATVALNVGLVTDTATTNGQGVAAFQLTANWADLPSNPAATVAFSDPGVYGTDSCSIDLPLAQYEVQCNPGIDWAEDQQTVTLFLSATARNALNNAPLANVGLTATVALDQGAATDTATTGAGGVANFQITVNWADLPPNPSVTVTFSDPGTYGADSCSIDLDLPRYEVRCNPEVGIDEGEIGIVYLLSATAWDKINDGPVAAVDLTATVALNQGSATDTATTDAQGVANFSIEISWQDLPQNAQATVTFSDQNTYGADSCTIGLLVPA